jgi:dipeptidyl-peptidase-4
VFARQHARTRRFTLGAPRSFRVARDGSRVAFLRSAGGADPLTALWVLDLPEGGERCVADPAALAASETELPPEERARRERVREAAGGIVRFAADRDLRRAVFGLGGRAFLAGLEPGGVVTALDVAGPVIDPALDPTGRRVAFVRDGALVAVDPDRPEPVVLAGEDAPDVTWGLAEFVAAEEMGRTEGFWWSPDGEAVAAARVDNRPVARWWITDPSEPSAEPRPVRYPAAGTANADVTLAVLRLDGRRVDVEWDRDAYPYLAAVRWDEGGGPLLTVQSRDQRTLLVLEADPDRGTTRVVATERDHDWVELLPGTPRRLPGGRVLHAHTSEGRPGLAVDGVALNAGGLHVHGVVGPAGGAVLVTASAEDPTAVGVWAVPLADGPEGGDPAPRRALTPPGGVHAAAAAGGVVVLASRSLDHDGERVQVRAAGGTTVVRTFAETPALRPRPKLDRVGERALATALLLPHGFSAADGPLPVLMDPYGGPHLQRVVQSRGAFGVSQWFADAGFAVVVADGRGTPGRGADWERAVAGDLAGPPLADQVDALHAVAERNPGVCDLDRVAIRGWSFGGFLAALAVLRRPDVFHAAVAGAPVAEWSLYDTHYTERYLGDPRDEGDAYRASSLLGDAASLERPLLLIHGLADDNVVAAHTLRLSRALVEAGRPHRVLPLVGITHMTPQEVVAENLLRLELRFLRDALPAR